MMELICKDGADERFVALCAAPVAHPNNLVGVETQRIQHNPYNTPESSFSRLPRRAPEHGKLHFGIGDRGAGQRKAVLLCLRGVRASRPAAALYKHDPSLNFRNLNTMRGVLLLRNADYKNMPK